MPASSAYDSNYPPRYTSRRYATSQNLAYDPAYDPDYDPVYDPAYSPERYPQPDISVVPGAGAEPATHTLSPNVVLAARIAVVVFIAFALIGVVQVTLSSSSIAVGIEAQEYSNQLDAARSQTGELEVTLASLSNPTRIKSEATALGMSGAETTTVIDLTDDIVMTDETGALSLSESVAALTTGQITDQLSTQASQTAGQ